MNIHNHSALYQFIHGPVIKGDVELGRLLAEADQFEGCALYCPDFYTATFPYAGNKLIDILGIHASELMKEGFQKILEVTRPSDLPHLTARQTMYMQMVSQPEFELSTILLHHYKFVAIWKSGTQKKVQVLGVLLNFNEHREFRVGVGFILPDDEHSVKTRKKCEELLIKIKDRHNKIWHHPEGCPDTPYLLHYLDATHRSITMREREVLGLLAKGMSTKESAAKLGLSEHTIETHRKHLLEKFDARNSAELIKKAGKVFWLE
jgi:DNA-binding CsgD family transcriptional regulator